jgi:peptidyl-tRNA hydrolase
MRIKILVRRNLKMSDKKMSAQCVHAALGLYKANPQDHWSCVVLDASDNKFDEAKAAHPEAYVVTDAGYTEVPAGSETAIAWYEDDPRDFVVPLDKI